MKFETEKQVGGVELGRRLDAKSTPHLGLKPTAQGYVSCY